MEKSKIDDMAFRNLTYGLFFITANDGDKDNGCIVNTVGQITVTPNQISISMNKNNLTHDMVLKTGVLNVSVLTQATPFSVFENFGLVSGKNEDKFKRAEAQSWSSKLKRAENGCYYLANYANAMFSCKVVSTLDAGTHTIFLAEVMEAQAIGTEPSCSYAYYFENIKPKPQLKKEEKTGYICKICNYVYEGESLPADFICPLCKHGASDFTKL